MKYEQRANVTSVSIPNFQEKNESTFKFNNKTSRIIRTTFKEHKESLFFCFLNQQASLTSFYIQQKQRISLSPRYQESESESLELYLECSDMKFGGKIGNLTAFLCGAAAVLGVVAAAVELDAPPATVAAGLCFR